MHSIEPFYGWRNLYASEEDTDSPFFGREYSEFYYSEKIYDHYIHPQWDNFGSSTLFMKLLYADYDEGYAIIELMGEWNDTLHNDVMFFKRDIAEELMYSGISKFILIGENVLNFHSSDDCYYEEWFDEINEVDGWISLLNFREHVLQELQDVGVDSYFLMGGQLDELAWRTYRPLQLYQKVEAYVQRRLMPPS